LCNEAADLPEEAITPVGDHEMKFDNEEVGEDEEYQMVGVETSSETIDSDQADVNGLSPTLLPGDLRP